MKRWLAKLIETSTLGRKILAERQKRQWNAWVRSWHDFHHGLTPKALDDADPAVLVIGGDPLTVVGSVGDDAMITAMLAHLKQKYGEMRVGVITASDYADHVARQHGFEPLHIFSEPFDYPRFKSMMLAFKPTVAFLVGADIMDGYYSPQATMRLLSILDLVARLGVETYVTGFSLNENPAPELKEVFLSLDMTIPLNLRDSYSLRRFEAFTGLRANLVADVAFLL